MNKNILELFALDIDNRTVYVGTDISTRELCFYVSENNKMVPISEELYKKVSNEIFGENKDNDSFKELLESLVRTYSEDNTNKSYDNTNLIKNWKHIRILYSQSSFDNSSASYEAINNILNFELPNELLSFSWPLSFQEKAALHTILIHEIGHMSVSEMQIKNNSLVAQTGFYEKRFLLKESILTTDGNNYFRVEENKELQINDGEGLEELFNELETDERANSATAPKFAHDLDDLTDGKLRIARQSHSLDSYYRMMQEMIQSEDMAKLLLIAINKYYECLHSQDFELAKQIDSAINQVLLEYQISKAKLTKR